jgi:hypothetical protein
MLMSQIAKEEITEVPVPAKVLADLIEVAEMHVNVASGEEGLWAAVVLDNARRASPASAECVPK